VHDAYEQTLGPTFRKNARDAQSPLGDDLTEQNVQARVRGALLMAFSNRYNHLLLTTGNKSELAVGYCTLYGDMCGGLAVISDVPKTTVWEMSRWINQHSSESGAKRVIPTRSITKVPSAELGPTRRTRIRSRRTNCSTRSCTATSRRRKASGDRGRRVRSGDGDARDPDVRPKRIQASPGRPRVEGHQPRVRLRPADAHRAALRSDPPKHGEVAPPEK
jgi:hypothetical protein